MRDETADLFVLANRIVMEPTYSRSVRRKAWDYDNAVNARAQAENNLAIVRSLLPTIPDVFVIEVEKALSKEAATKRVFQKCTARLPRASALPNPA